MYFSAVSQGVPPLGGVKQGWSRENKLFSSCVNVLKTEGNTSKITINEYD